MIRIIRFLEIKWTKNTNELNKLILVYYNLEQIYK